jgi:tRNA modification GTPase
MVSTHDIIAALATPVGTSAIAVVRASGPDCAEISRAIFGTLPSPRVAAHHDYRDRNGAILDDVVATFFVAPHSYTGEDTLEVSCHGNPFIAQKILEDLFARGCRAADAGEFTRRAFLSGRIDLSQAEAVMDLIHARSERALDAANQQLRGSLGRHLAQLTDDLLGALARIEAYIDFPDEDLPTEDRGIVRGILEQLITGTTRLLATQHYGDLLRDGIKTVIIGEPNAGKSSLLNRLVGHDRALVSPEPGTTRDFIEERLVIGPHCIRLIDTAGLNPSPAPLERLGIAKTLERAAEADLFLLVLDATRPHPAFPPEISERLSAKNAIVVLNKADLGVRPEAKHELAGRETVEISALTGDGLETLISLIVSHADSYTQIHGAEIIAINARHADALKRAQGCLAEALAKLTAQGPIELLASDLRGALDAFGEIGGKIDNERMLDRLFATFCIGK